MHFGDVTLLSGQEGLLMEKQQKYICFFRVTFCFWDISVRENFLIPL